MVISNGSVANADEVLALNAINQVYTGTGFDSTTATADPDIQDHELDAVSSAPDSNYAVVKITGTSRVVGDSSSGAAVDVQLKAQIKETGGVYADIVAFKISIENREPGVNVSVRTSLTYEIVATLTAGMKTNGFQIKVFSRSDKGGTSQASFTNIQTVQEVRA